MKMLFVIAVLSISFQGVSQLPSYAPTQDLLAWYSFSGNILDNSGNGHNNANYNIVSTTDRFNTMLRALYFSGSGSEYLNYGDVDDFEGWIQLSYSFWILPQNHGGGSNEQFRPIISKWAAPNDLQGSSYNIIMDGSNLCLILSDGSATDTLKTSLSTIPLNQWSHVVITTNYGFVKIYINNVLITDTVTTISQIKSSTRDFKVGDWYKSDNASYSAYHGKIDDIGLWNRELDACEVDALFTGNSCQTASLEKHNSPFHELVRITDLMGREVNEKSNSILLYVFSDGTIEKVYIVE